MLWAVILFLIFSINQCYGQGYIYSAGPLVPSSKGQVWPKPASQTPLADGYFKIVPRNFQFSVTGSNCSTLQRALRRYQIIIKFSYLYDRRYYNISKNDPPSDPKYLGHLSNLNVQLNGNCDDNEYPSFEMKENYTLNVSSSTQELRSDTLWGILRGLETFSQLIYISDNHKHLQVNTTNISDYPRFAHRGLLLDASRHYIHRRNIFRLLNGMAYNKFNVFHWHISDDPSFPYVSRTYPELSEKGAYHSILGVYDQRFVRSVIEHARRRGIRVLIEFDTPGHTLSWGVSHPEILTKCVDVPILEYGPMDPTKNSTYDFVFALYDEIKSVFKDNYVHLGGDEVDPACWKSNPNISKFMEDNGIAGDYEALQNMYSERLANYVSSLNLTSVVWEEVFLNGAKLPANSVVNVWQNASVTLQVTQQGYRVIDSSSWYLDKVATGGDWLKYYNADPQNFEGSPEQHALVIGAEASMWTGVVDDANLEPMVWPRACAAAERFWSLPSVAPTSENPFVLLVTAAPRLEEQTCRLKRRGIRARPPTGASFCL